MKGIIRIAGLDFKGFSYVYWNLYVVREMVKRAKRLVGSTGVKSFHIFFKTGRDRYRVDYLLISCPLSVWQKLKGEIEGRYVCVDPTFKFNKRKQSWVRTEVGMWTERELEGELSDFPVLIDARQGKNKSAEFEVMWGKSNSDLDVFYKPFSEFDACIWEGNHEKNLWAGTLILEAERKWKRDGGDKVWRKRKAWKTKDGNYEEVK